MKHNHLSGNGLLGEFQQVEGPGGVAGFLPFRHLPTGIDFALIPPGRFEMGLSQAEEMQAKRICSRPPLTISEMRPVTSIPMKPFLISALPVLNGQLNASGSSVGGSSFFPALIDYAEAESFAHHHGFRLPTEAEWEYSCRGGSADLFVWGDQLPSESELAKWLEWNLEKPQQLRRNRFGLAGLFFGEWCTDKFRENLSSASEPTNWQVIKGGGAFFWPWQDAEWVWCMPAMRMPSSALVTQESAFRLIVELESWPID